MLCRVVRSFSYRAVTSSLVSVSGSAEVSIWETLETATAPDKQDQDIIWIHPRGVSAMFARPKSSVFRPPGRLNPSALVNSW